MFSTPTRLSTRSWKIGRRENPVSWKTVSVDSIEVVSSTMVTSMRGVITSRAVVSPKSSTLYSITCSPCSMVPSFLPTSIHSRISSSVTAGSPFASAVPIVRESRFSTRTTGETIRERIRIGPADRSATPSRNRAATIMGPIWPTTSRARAVPAIASGTPPGPNSASATSVASAAAATQTRVVPIRVVIRIRSGSARSSARAVAPRRWSLTSVRTRAREIEISATSALAKKAARRRQIPKNAAERGSNCTIWFTPAVPALSPHAYKDDAVPSRGVGV